MSRLAPILALLLLGLLGLLGLVGCSSEPVAEDSLVEMTLQGELVVTVYSQKVQGPVPARGTITSLSTLESTPFDTLRAVEGKSLRLDPGRYTVAVSHRLLSSGRPQPVSGEQVLYVEPGARQEVTVVVKDRKGDLGRVTSTSPLATAPPLPPEPSSG